LNKIDVEGAQAHVKRFRKKFSSYKIFEISALEKKGLKPLVDELRSVVAKEKSERDLQQINHPTSLNILRDCAKFYL
jgi:predicted GTPase